MISSFCTKLSIIDLACHTAIVVFFRWSYWYAHWYSNKEMGGIKSQAECLTLEE